VTVLVEAMGSARGPVRELAPVTRLATGLMLLVACLVSVPDRPTGGVQLLLTAALWLLACRPPWRVLGRTALWGLVLVGPFGLLTLAAPGPPEVGWRIVARGLGALLVGAATLWSLRVAELHRALRQLGLPRTATAVVTQICQQAGTLLGETRRISTAIKLRGASRRFGVLAALPRVWLPRVLQRSERVAMAMQVRGYDPAAFDQGPAGLRWIDGATLLLAALWVAATVALRLWGRMS
jgi:energy-coupling factor transporter transmembrane protein EcfT